MDTSLQYIHAEGSQEERIAIGQPDTTRPSDTARYVSQVWLFGLAFVLYLDRICWQQAVTPIREEHLTKTQMGLIAMAFTIAYGIFEIPTGRLGDRIGSRYVLVRIVVWWSLFTMLTGAAWGFVSLIAVRFCSERAKLARFQTRLA